MSREVCETLKQDSKKGDLLDLVQRYLEKLEITCTYQEI